MRLLFQEKTQVQKERPISLLALPPSEERNPDAPNNPNNPKILFVRLSRPEVESRESRVTNRDESWKTGLRTGVSLGKQGYDQQCVWKNRVTDRYESEVEGLFTGASESGTKGL